MNGIIQNAERRQLVDLMSGGVHTWPDDLRYRSAIRRYSIPCRTLYDEKYGALNNDSNRDDKRQDVLWMDSQAQSISGPVQCSASSAQWRHSSFSLPRQREGRQLGKHGRIVYNDGHHCASGSDIHGCKDDDSDVKLLSTQPNPLVTQLPQSSLLSTVDGLH